ncbi:MULTISPECIES: tRNA (adenosine(37)-N6)-threonylcarbamoyltransferase complex dimerization subunit type 1 TsaB [unclassified Rathayibacter]|uniref:tRNA (adenosine(37)-N6)-threonylcarbamoyltransferase complex dimerization subunit type 1 TsaB n=1 Tax=unclassified Rathayibacter TaxID=2609250 RepID=UPI000CE80047|nr:MULTISPECIES: tRNA (adenosine(37)-N6)-threonylcarbamoyltransferase complex dimerization subunit type 1 TsaB [unclassified Rathayibacter]PPG48589.1 tRNA (adenosine(37)-N6)-threonylcarbamoyltransferase complex dimerization subunit type 1 TsaB [Rathayibacter sp. AY2B3]PPI18043.1 tRNA (adenosine(37)-N6)-threonylcarbamoyltransferase complex dimerization subunit type 1 TsaB [Rathayibacter sp. AY1B6]PPI20309.1 tRNA (adenosine(37)-N6)-threonylcarbamoyltransferase complex dimerization subunit type 1 T
MLLAIDTSSGTSVAVVDSAGAVRSERTETDTMRHAEVVGRLIQEALEAAGVAPAGIEAVAVGMGPGPFTGLRVGIAAARAFALGRGVPTLPVVSHDAIALAALRHGRAAGFLVVTDARRRELYWSAYGGLDDQGLPVRLAGPGLDKPPALPHPELPRLEAESVSAGELGVVAARLRAAGRPGAADEPLYLRSPDVTLSAGPKRVTA